MRIRSVGAALSAAVFVLVPWGGGAQASGAAGGPPASAAPADSEPHPIEPPALPSPQRRVDLEMKDTAFSPTTLDVRLGETVTFVFTNTGRLVHDAFLGDRAAQDEHERQMREAGHEHDHAGHDDAVTVHPGETAAMRYQFQNLGELEIGCHQPGHYAAGMKILIRVNLV